MVFEHVVVNAEVENLAKKYNYHIFYLKDEKQPESLDDADLFLGSDYATSVICRDEKELHSLLGEINEEYYDTLKSEYGYQGIHAVEINGVFLVSLEIDYFEKDKCNKIMNNFIVIGSQCDDVCLLDLIPYRKKVEEGVFKDVKFEKLEDFFQNKFTDLEEKYSENNQECEYNDLENSIDFYLRVLEYCGNGNQKEKLDFIINKVQDLLYLHTEVE